MKRGSIFSIALMISILIACGKRNTQANNTPPSNLTLIANVSTDNSGNVTFTASATNAVSYEFNFGNSISQIVPTGVVTYRYPTSDTYTITVIAKSAGGQTISKSIQITVTVVLSLAWSEEFDTPGAPGAAKWGYDLGGGGWGNNELQYYTNRADNVIISNGTLKIIAKKENYSGSGYTSARILTKDKFSFKYGKIEARAKLPAGAGTWPAIWMLGNNIAAAGWPGCGEIDIMEHVGNQLNKIFGTLHHPGHAGGSADGGNVIISTATTTFHKYTVEWSVFSIKFLVDDVTFYTFTNYPSLPFNQNFFIILNVAMGGNFGGAVDPAYTSAELEIDYIRVYQ